MKTASPNFRIPDPTIVLFTVATVSTLLWTAGAGWVSILPATVMVLPIVVYLLVTRLDFAALGLIAASAMSRYFVQISGLKARPEHIAVGLLCLAAPFWIKNRTHPVCWIPADYLLLAYIGSNLFSSLFTSPEPSQTFRWACQQIVVIMAYFIVRLVASDFRRFRRVFGILLMVGVLEGAYAIMAFFSNLVFHTSFGMELEQYGTIPGTYGTQYEANLLGSYSGACFVMLLLMYFVAPRRRYLAGICVTFAAVAISLSRAAVAATAVAALIAVYFAWKLRLLRRSALRNVGLIVVAVSLVLAPVLLSLYSQRLSTVDITDITADETIGGRVLSSAIALDDIVVHPVFGTGTSSFQLTFDYSQIDPSVEAGWIGNTELRVLHDTGFIGLAIFVSFLALLVVPGWKLLKQDLHPELLALLVAGIVYCVSFQATEGTLLAFSWVHLGLIASGISLHRSHLQ